MIEKLDFLVQKHQDLVKQIADPAVIANNKEWQILMREHSALEPIVEKYQEYKSLKESLDENKEMLTDKSLEDDFRDMVKEEIKEIEEQLPKLEQDIRTMLIPKDPNDDKNVIVEIRAGAGGDEAGLFAGDLFRMYTRYVERNRWKIELMSVSDNGVGGYKEIIFLIKGKGVYSRMKYESGTHRVQRVPATESAGRIHTSIATVAVLPEVDDVEVNIQANDVRCDVYRSSGNGGQSVNTTDSAVRLTHIPTGIVVAMQDEKSQLKNKAKAMRILKARIYEKQLDEQNKEIAAQRKIQVGTGDRSAKIRTYNFPQGRVSDHRITMTIHKLEAFLDGDINEMLDALITSDNAEKLKQINK